MSGNNTERRSQIVFMAGIGLCILGVFLILMARSERKPKEPPAPAVAAPVAPPPVPAPEPIAPVTPSATAAPLTREGNYLDEMRAALRVLVTSEEVMFAEAMVYTSDLSKLPGYSVPDGVSVQVMSVDQTGYQAAATHKKLRGESCAVFIGGAQPIAPARQMGRITCSTDQ